MDIGLHPLQRCAFLSATSCEQKINRKDNHSHERRCFFKRLRIIFMGPTTEFYPQDAFYPEKGRGKSK